MVRSNPEVFYQTLLSKSNSKIKEEAVEEWIIEFKSNIDMNNNHVGYLTKNRCHSELVSDGCKCVTNDYLDKKRLKQCRMVNYQKLNLDVNTGTNYSCICNEPIIYVYKITNIINGNSLPENENESGIGSECIKKFLPKLGISLTEYIENANFENYPHLYCRNCRKRHKRPNPENDTEWFRNCVGCPPLCDIMNCREYKYKKELCKKHLGIK